MVVPSEAPTPADIRCTVDLCRNLRRETNSPVLLLDEAPSVPAEFCPFPAYAEDGQEPLAYWPGGTHTLQKAARHDERPFLTELHQQYPWLVVVSTLADLTPALTAWASRCVLLLPAQVATLGAVMGKTRHDLFPAPPDVIVHHPAGDSPEIHPHRLATALGCNLLGTLQIPAEPQESCLGVEACSSALCTPTALERQREVKERLASLLQGDRAAIRQAAGGEGDGDRLAGVEEVVLQKLRQTLDLRRRLLLHKSEVAQVEASIQQHVQGIRQYIDHVQLPTPAETEAFQRQSLGLTELQQRLYEHRASCQSMRSRYHELRDQVYEHLALAEE